MRGRAARLGRTLRYGIRLHLIVRETEGEAWDAARGLIRHLSDDTIATAQRKLAAESDSEGQRRMLALHGGSRERLEVSPNLWAGVGLVRGGAGTALVGGPAHGGGAHPGVSGAGHRYADRPPAIRISTRHTAWRSCCSRCWGSAGPAAPGGPSLLTGGGSFMTTSELAAVAR